MKTDKNKLTVAIYDGVTPIYDLDKSLKSLEGLYFETCYPGGRYLSAGGFAPRKSDQPTEIKNGMRFEVKHGSTVVYEGYISNLRDVTSDTSSGLYIPVRGAWGWLLENRQLRKRWADDRVDDQTWETSNVAAAAEKCTIDRRDRIRFTPKSETWGNNEQAQVNYILPTGETITKVTYDYDLQEAAQAWELDFWDATNGASSIATASGSAASQTYTLSTPSQTLSIRYWSRAAAQTPTSDGTYYGELSNIMVYSETEASGIRLYSIAEDIISEFSADLNSSTDWLTDMSSIKTVEPFITNGDGPESLASILIRAAGFGDSNGDRYAIGLLASDASESPDGKPVMFMEPYPSIDNEAIDYDYVISKNSPNLVGNLELERNLGHNYIIVGYRDERGWQQWVTPDNDASLKDSTAITDNSERWHVLALGNSTQADAIAYGVRYLEARKDARWDLKSPITIIDAVEASDSAGGLVPTCRVRAGKRIKINGYGIYLITKTRYDHNTRSVQVWTGQPEDPYFEQAIFAPAAIMSASGGGTTTSGDTGGNVPWWRHADISDKEKTRMRRENPELWHKKKKAHREQKRKRNS